MGRATVGGSVVFDDIAGDLKISAARDVQVGRTALSTRQFERTGLITYSDIDTLIAECFPAPPSLPGQLPNVSYLYCDSLTCVPFGDVPATCPTLAFPTYSVGRVTITYSTLPYNTSDLIQRRYSIGAEFLSMPTSGLRWESEPATSIIESEDVVAQKRISIIEHSMTFNRVASIPWSAIRNNIGKVNDGTYEGAADQTLLFSGAEISFTVAAEGTVTWTLDYRFQERIVTDETGSTGYDQTFGWNHVYRAETKAWERVLDADGNPLYPLSADFADLF